MSKWILLILPLLLLNSCFLSHGILEINKEQDRHQVINYFPDILRIKFANVYYVPEQNYIQVFDANNTLVTVGDTVTKDNNVSVVLNIQHTGEYVVYYHVACDELCLGAFTFTIVNPYNYIDYGLYGGISISFVLMLAISKRYLIRRKQ